MDLLNDELLLPITLNYTLKSSDGQSFQVDLVAIKKSGLVNEKIQKNPEETDIHLPEVEGKTLKKIVEYLLHYKDTDPKEIPRPLKDSKIENVLDKWDYEFIIGISMADCIDLINAANYMDILPLLKLACARVAAKMIELPLDEVVSTFEIECDMSEEETMQFDKYNLSTTME